MNGFPANALRCDFSCIKQRIDETRAWEDVPLIEKEQFCLRAFYHSIVYIFKILEWQKVNLS